MPGPRRCKGCGETYPLTDEYWNRRGDDRTKWRPQCKVCNNAYWAKIKKAKSVKVDPVAGRKARLPPCVRVVAGPDGKLRSLGYLEDEPGEDETWVGIGSHLMNFADGRAKRS